MSIGNVELLHKLGGKSGEFSRSNADSDPDNQR
jgi:hypothetical protein